MSDELETVRAMIASARGQLAVTTCVLVAASAALSMIGCERARHDEARVPVLASGPNGVGGSICVVLESGRVACAGPVATPPQELGEAQRLVEVEGLPRSAAVALSQFAREACARTVNGDVWCWAADGRAPQRVAGLERVIRLVGADRAFCAVTSDQRVWCWGDNEKGIVAPQSEAPGRMGPVVVEGIPSATDVRGGVTGACALAADGAVWCWGKMVQASAHTPVQIVGAGPHAFVETSLPGPVCFRLGDGGQRCVPEASAP